MARGVQLSQPNGISTNSQLTRINPNQDRTWLEWIGQQFAGKPEVIDFLSKYDPQQQQAQSSVLQSGLNQLQNPYQGYDPIKQDTMNTFYQDIVPRLQEQFSASGSNATSSPILQTNISSAGGSLAQRLQAFQSQFGQQAEQTGLQKVSLGLNPKYEIANRPAQPGLIENGINAGSEALPLLAKAAYAYYTGGIG